MALKDTAKEFGLDIARFVTPKTTEIFLGIVDEEKERKKALEKA